MSAIPKVSVVMPVYNREEYIKSAIDSVLMQTYKDFELIVVDDGSTDSTVDIVKSYDDSRIRLIQHEINKGVAAARNTGYRNARGEFIVIADSDDINLPTKIEEQVRYLDEHKDIDIVGCIYKPFREETFLPNWFVYEDNDYIKSLMIFNPGAPAAIMFRVGKIKSVECLFHDESYTAAVDYEWFSNQPDDVKFGNILKPLYLYRWHDKQISTKGGKQQKRVAEIIRQKNLKKMNISPTKQEELAHTLMSEFYNMDRMEKPLEPSFLIVKEWAEKLIAYNSKYLVYPVDTFKYVVSRRFYDLCDYFGQFGKSVWDYWEKYQHKDVIRTIDLNFKHEKILKITKNKKVAVFGTLRSCYQILCELESLGIKASYLIDNNVNNTFEKIDGYSIYPEKILFKDPIDVLILSNLSDSRFLIKERINKHCKNIEIVILDEIIM